MYVGGSRIFVDVHGHVRPADYAPEDNGLGGWYSYRASKAALNQYIRTTAIEYARSFPKLTCVAIHPGTVRTKFTEKYLGRHPAISPEDASRNILQLADILKPNSSGQFFDWDRKPVPW